MSSAALAGNLGAREGGIMAGRIITMYDIGRSVGHRGENQSPDVMLIQFFLLTIFMDPGYPVDTAFSLDTAVDTEAVAPRDGVFKPGLVDWILMFQRIANKTRVGPIVVDGRVDPSNVGWGLKGNRTQGRRTIMALDQVLLNGDRNRFERLFEERNMPAQLQRTVRFATSIG
jgi:hypothetical protein